VAKTQAKSVGATGIVAGVHFLRAEVPDVGEPQLSDLRHEAEGAGALKSWTIALPLEWTKQTSPIPARRMIDN